MDQVTQLTRHFSLEDLTRSQTASRFGIDNSVSPEIFRNLIRLCEEILEPLCNAAGRPIVVSSGYRCQKLNTAVGGAKGSDHTTGLAADIVAPGMSVDALMEVIRTLAPYVPLKVAIREYPPLGWAHVACLPEGMTYKPEPEFLVATLVNGETLYSRWSSSMNA